MEAHGIELCRTKKRTALNCYNAVRKKHLGKYSRSYFLKIGRKKEAHYSVDSVPDTGA